MQGAGLEFLLILLATLLAVALLIGARGRRLLCVPALLVFVLVPCGIWRLEAYRESRGELRPAEEDVANRPVRVEENDYVSSRTCEACHPREYTTWHASYHRTMTQVASTDSVIGNFDGRTRTVFGRDIRLLREGERFLVEMVEDPVAGRGPVVRRPVVMTTGYHHMQAYWYATGKGRELALIPLVYLRDDQRWIPERASFLKPDTADYPADVVGLWNRGCQQCHSTAAQPRVEAMDTKVAELGIACEACHGPAREHVSVNRDPRRRYRFHLGGETDPTIVNPGRLAADASTELRASEVCGQCHGIWEAVDLEEDRRALAEGFSYRPGDELLGSKFTISRENFRTPRVQALLRQSPKYLVDRYWPDGMIRVSGREFVGLLDSPCFHHGDPEKKRLSCLSCHAMHQPAGDTRSLAEWADDQMKPDMEEGNAACLQCHEDIGEELEGHTHHRTDSSGSVCYNCHMPYTTYGLLKAIRSHTISSPSVQESVQGTRPNACNLCHLDRTLRWTAESLHERHGTPKPPLSAEQQSIAASILWILKGDAGQRALVAWAMGWEPAQKSSGVDWLLPFVGQALDDPYRAVRYIAQRSLRSLPHCDGIPYDYLSTPEKRRSSMKTVMAAWGARVSRTTGQHLLIPAPGRLIGAVFSKLIDERDQRLVNLEE